MKIQLDTKEKTISIKEDVIIGDLIKTLKKLFPEDEWKEFVLKPFVQEKWLNPYVVRTIEPWHYYKAPWYVLCSAPDVRMENVVYNTGAGSNFLYTSSGTVEEVINHDTGVYTLAEGTFCIEIE